MDEFAILQTLYEFTHAQDHLDLAAMASALMPGRNIVFDLSKHFPDIGPLQGNPAEIANILYEASAGWTATQHPVFNPIVTIDSGTPNRAKVHAMLQSYHCLELDGIVNALTIHATWILEMEKAEDKWRIARMAMERDVPIANAELFEKMREQMASGKKRQPLTIASV